MALPELALGSPPGFDLCVYFVVYDLVAFAARPGASQPIPQMPFSPDASGRQRAEALDGRPRPGLAVVACFFTPPQVGNQVYFV